MALTETFARAMRLRFHFFTASNKFGEMIKQRVSLDLEFFRFSLKKEKKKKKK